MNRFEIPALGCVTVLLPLVFLVSFSVGLQAQSSPDPNQPASLSIQPAPATPDSAALAEIAIQTRIQRARALTAAHQLEIAASELESVRAGSQDMVVRNIASVMLMSIYLEAANYGRAEALLEESFRDRAVQNGDSLRTYFALAGQAINGARTHLSRYRSFGINTLDSNLPREAVTDLDRLRSFLERMIAQAKEVANERRAYDSLSLLEDVLGIRLSLARDGEDQAKWSTEYVAARELLAASPTQIASLRGMSALPPSKVKSTKSPSSLPYAVRRGSDNPEKKAADKNEDAAHPRGSNEPEAAPPLTAPAKSESVQGGSAPGAQGQPLSNFGLLNAKASRRVLPRYPALAKKAGAVGLVRVHVVVDESGKVIEISGSDGPTLLKQVAEDAARQWFFEGLAGPGQAVRFTGYIDFNFTL
ncbi:MAG TPA: TonB family protein [Pyrinomonadaceae bacterium]|nr:TonB family protein [Pyrinomonadaceae bacterium]